MRAESNPIALVITIREFLEGIKDVRIERFLADWPSENCITRSVLPHGLPVLSWLPHAMRTETVPLLTRYLWRGGNLVQKSLIE